MADKTAAEIAALRKEVALLVRERVRLREGLRQMFGHAVHYVDMYQAKLLGSDVSRPEVKDRLKATDADSEKIRHIMKINGLTD